MTYLLLQTFLLLLSAYFLGAFLACLMKRTVLRRAELAAAAPHAHLQPVPVRDPAPLSRPRTIDPVQPRIDILPRPEPKAAPAQEPVDISRFHRALAGPDPNEGMPRKMIVEIRPAILKSPTGPAQALKPQTAAPKQPEQKVEQKVEPKSEPKPEPKIEPAKPSVPIVEAKAPVPAAKPAEPAKSQTAVPTVGQAGASAAAAAAAVAAAQAAANAASAAAVKKPEVKAAEPAADVKETAKPAPAPIPAAPSPAQTPTAKAAPPTAQEPQRKIIAGADDLQCIRAIDGDTERRLNDIGVYRFDHIALWTADDVNRVNQAVGLTGRIDREQWIEQAQILAKGGETYYSRNRAAAARTTDQVASKPSEKPPTEKPVTPSVAATVAPQIAKTAGLQQPQSRPPMPATPGASPSLRPSAPPSEPQPAANPARPSPAVSAATAATAAAAAAAASIVSAASAKPAIATQAPSPATVPATSATPTPSTQAMPAAPQVVADLGPPPKAAATIAAVAAAAPQGRSVSEMAAAAAAAIAAASASVTRGIRPIEPISPLSRANPNIVMPARLSDALKDKEGKSPSESASKEQAGTRPKSDVARAPRSDKADDLKRIRGIGVLIEKRLNALGVETYADIANWTSGDIDRISQTLDFKGRIERENWVEQARILSNGGHTEFSRRVDRGDVETSRDPEDA